ncbi:MAG: thioesterase family protein [Flavobacteriales bacterium]|nr:thioesterase family protein [Flavobacteriales bacterium]
MEFKIKEGIALEQHKVVSKNDTAKFFGSGNLEVFATPAMVALMELTAQKSVSALTEKYSLDTVGTEINVKHIRATPVDDTIKCISKLTKVDGRSLEFEIEVFDSKGKIGMSTHKRFVIDPEKFMAKL